MFGVGIDRIYSMNQNEIISGNPYSQDRYTALDSLFAAWYVFPIIVVVLGLFWSIKQAIADKDTVI